MSNELTQSGIPAGSQSGHNIDMPRGRTACPSHSAKRLLHLTRVLALPLLCVGLLGVLWASPPATAFSVLFLNDARAAGQTTPRTAHSTTFPGSENPISESGNWING